MPLLITRERVDAWVRVLCHADTLEVTETPEVTDEAEVTDEMAMTDDASAAALADIASAAIVRELDKRNESA